MMLFLNYILKNEKATGLPIEIHKTRCVYVCEPASSIHHIRRI